MKSKEKLRNLIPGYTIEKSGAIILSLDADDDFRHDVHIVYRLNEENEMLSILSFSELSVPQGRESDAILFCNRYKAEHAFSQVYYNCDNRDFHAEWYLDTENMTDAGLRRQIRLVASAAWQFFVCAGKEF